ncbi:MAG: diguanylate cyclase [Gammaproteobacteria bacterium]|nr:diguanylate cyclase [Gammaproteobacteria bacterium]
MKGMNCKNKHKGGFCILAFVVKVLLIVAVAELAIHLYSMSTGAGADVADLLKTIVRMLIIAVGIYFFFGRDKSEQGRKEVENSETDTETVAVTEDEDFNNWPNIDSLTRTSNERGLTISILELMALADRYGHKLSIGMIKVDGIDGLKKPAADDAMINMAGLMTESIRMPDRIGRFKENVFMVLLPESDIKGAAIVADRLRGNLEQGETEGYADTISVWIGMTEFQRGEDLQSLLDRVEDAANQSRNEENGICIKYP